MKLQTFSVRVQGVFFSIKKVVETLRLGFCKIFLFFYRHYLGIYRKMDEAGRSDLNVTKIISFFGRGGGIGQNFALNF